MSFQTGAGCHMSCKQNLSRFYKKDKLITESHVNLQTQKNNILTQNDGSGMGERASVFVSFVRGSFTVEASVVMAVFILSVYGFLYLFLVFRMQVVLQEAAEQAAQTAARYAYAKECLMEGTGTEEEWMEAVGEALQWGIQTGLLRQNIIGTVSEEYPGGSCIKGGNGGIRLLESRILEEDGMVDVVMRYDVEIPVGFPGMTRFQFVQRSRKRGWIGLRKQAGEAAEEEREEWAYVTETGSVYHLYEDCTHIKLSIREADYRQVQQYRNESGGTYKPCEKCCGEGSAGGSVYITKDGDRYHSTLGCSGLKRQVMKVPKDEAAAGMRLCSRCRARQQKEHP